MLPYFVHEAGDIVTLRLFSSYHVGFVISVSGSGSGVGYGSGAGFSYLLYPFDFM